MCRATGCGPGSPVCSNIYYGKGNHSSANCRYRPRDNWEEPRQTPDALRTGATSENSASASRNQTGPAPHTTNLLTNSKSRGTTFKIDTGGYVFSCLFDSGAEISCMNMETIATLGLTSQITPSSVSVNTANGDHMGIAGNVRVNFKIGKKCSFTHNFVVCKRLS